MRNRTVLSCQSEQVHLPYVPFPEVPCLCGVRLPLLHHSTPVASKVVSGLAVICAEPRLNMCLPRWE